MMLRTLTIAILFFYSSLALALFCPKNFNQINIGDSIDQVATQCGQPDSQKSTKAEDYTTPQEWTFYASLPHNPQQNVGSVKMTVALDNGKVVNISSGGYSVGGSSVCSGKMVQMGSTAKEVIAACGKPTMISKSTAAGVQAPEVIITEWKYNSSPPVTLTFENGKLTSRD